MQHSSLTVFRKKNWTIWHMDRLSTLSYTSQVNDVPRTQTGHSLYVRITINILDLHITSILFHVKLRSASGSDQVSSVIILKFLIFPKPIKSVKMVYFGPPCTYRFLRCCMTLYRQPTFWKYSDEWRNVDAVTPRLQLCTARNWQAALIPSGKPLFYFILLHNIAASQSKLTVPTCTVILWL